MLEEYMTHYLKKNTSCSFLVSFLPNSLALKVEGDETRLVQANSQCHGQGTKEGKGAAGAAVPLRVRQETGHFAGTRGSYFQTGYLASDIYSIIAPLTQHNGNWAPRPLSYSDFEIQPYMHIAIPPAL